MRGTVRRLLGLLAPSAKWMALSILLGVATIGSGIALMATSAYIIAKAALQPSIAELQVAIVGVRFFGISRGLSRYLERLVSHQLTFRLLTRLRVWFYRSLEPLAPARLLSYRSGDLLARVVADVEILEDFYLRVVAPPLVALLVALLTGLLLAAFDPRLAAALLLFLALSGVGVPLLTRHLGRDPGRDLVQARSALNVALVDGVQGLADLLAFGRAGAQREQVRTQGRTLAHLQERMAWIRGLGSGLSDLLMHLATLAALLIAIPMVRGGELDGVYLALLVLAVIASFEAVAPLPAALQGLERGLTAARRLFEIVDAAPAVRDPPDPAPPPSGHSLRVENLRFRYAPGEPPALDGVSFFLPQGGRLAIVGPSGAGKTTLVNLLLRFWDYTEGHILLGEQELRRYSQETVREVTSVVAQRPHLFGGTVRENLLLARPDAREADLVRAARRARIHDAIRALPHGYDTWIGEGGRRLSGGERQRLAVARALLQEAPILILDEPTANLDPLVEQKLLQALYRSTQGRTTLVITHRLVGLEAMDEILVLRAGKVVERGRHHDLIQTAGLYSRMWRLQNQVRALETAFDRAKTDQV